MASVFVDDVPVSGALISGPEEVAHWTEMFSKEKKLICPEKLPGIEFWRWMKKHLTGPIEENDDKERNYGTMGWTYMYSVPSQHESDVITAFYQCVYVDNQPVCLAPALSKPYFQWFMDIDIKQKTPITMEYVMTICKIVVKTVSDFFPKLKKMSYKSNSPEWNNTNGWWMGAGEGIGRLRFVIATSGFKKGTSKDGSVEYGIGIHPYSIGRLLVDADQAKVIRLVIVNRCEEVLGRRKKEEGFNSWEDVFDANVYKGKGGTRMIGSCKVKTCEVCSPSQPMLSIKDEDVLLSKYEKDYAIIEEDVRSFKFMNGKCLKCHGKKKYLEKRAYDAKLVLWYDGRVDEELNWLIYQPYQLLLATHIRVHCKNSASTYFQCISGYSVQRNIMEGEEEIPKRLKFTAPKELEKEAKIGQRYPPDARETEMVMEYVHKISDLYSDISPHSLVRKGKQSYWLEVKNSRNWKYCLKCNKEHQNRIYFEVTPYKVLQKSHSNNQECKEASSPCVPISLDLRDALFQQSNNFDKSMLVPHEGFPVVRVNEKNMQLQKQFLFWVSGINKDSKSGETRKQKLENEAKRLAKNKKRKAPIWEPVRDVEIIDNIMEKGAKKCKSKISKSKEDFAMSNIVWNTTIY